MVNDWRRKDFEARFSEAARELGVSGPLEIESLKFRHLRGGRAEYDEMMKYLAAFKPRALQGRYGGAAWKLVGSDGSAIIIVEHETGLEILSIVGNVASIVSLVSLVAQAWHRLRDHWSPFGGHFGRGDVERRRLDPAGGLIEDPAPDIEESVVPYLLKSQNDLIARIAALEKEVRTIKKSVHSPQAAAPRKAKKVLSRRASPKDNKP